jgi:hypothetical protein
MSLRFIALFIGFLILPSLTDAAGLTKQEACTYPEGIHKEQVYILWPGKIVQTDEFLKKDGFLYYFIHTFADRNSLRQYNQIGNFGDGIIRNTGSYFVSFDCARSKVKFYPQIRSL